MLDDRFRPNARTTVVVMLVTAVLATVLWVAPNWNLFWSNVAQFPLLWQVPGNRVLIVYLILKMLSPFLLIALVWFLFWMYALLLESEKGSEGEAHASPFPGVTAVLPGPVTPSVRVAPAEQHGGMPPGASTGPISLLPSTTGALLRNGSPPAALSEHSELKVEESKAGDDPPLPAFGKRVAGEGPGDDASRDPNDPVIVIRLLKEVAMFLCLPDGKRVVVPLSGHTKRIQLLAYIAWRRGELIDREKLFEHVFGWGVPDEGATREKLAEQFDSNKKLLRRKIREIAAQVNKEAGAPLLAPDLDPFTANAGFWALSNICLVEDLEDIEQHYKVIALAQKEGKLVDAVPEYVQEACERIIAQYSGDFMEAMIKKYPGEFRAWQGRGHWVRRPLTLYRDYYLTALWYCAEAAWRLGQHYSEQVGKVEDEQHQQEYTRKRQEHFGRAAQMYHTYAMYACNSKLDTKVVFGPNGERGERVKMSERALRRCIVLLGATARTDLVDQCWSAYSTQMKTVSSQRWQPQAETLADLEAARTQTKGYRFAAQLSQLSGAFAQERAS